MLGIYSCVRGITNHMHLWRCQKPVNHVSDSNLHWKTTVFSWFGNKTNLNILFWCNILQISAWNPIHVKLFFVVTSWLQLREPSTKTEMLYRINRLHFWAATNKLYVSVAKMRRRKREKTGYIYFHNIWDKCLYAAKRGYMDNADIKECYFRQLITMTLNTLPDIVLTRKI